MNNQLTIQVLEEILNENQLNYKRKVQTYQSLANAIGSFPQDYKTEITVLEMRIKALQKAIEIVKFI